MSCYAVGIILQNSDNLTRIREISSALREIVDIALQGDGTYLCTLKSDSNAHVRFFIGVASDVPTNTKNYIGTLADSGNTRFLPLISFIWFGETYSLEQMRARLYQWIGQQWKGYYLILDGSSDLTNLESRFTQY